MDFYQALQDEPAVLKKKFREAGDKRHKRWLITAMVDSRSATALPSMWRSRPNWATPPVRTTCVRRSIT